MSLETISTKRHRVYHRMFDHDEARSLREEGWTYQALAGRYGVLEAAVIRVCDPRVNARMQEQSKRSLRRRRRPCLGGCGRLVWWHGNTSTRSGKCSRCIAAERTTQDVRVSELRCTSCREWKPDAEFPTYKASIARRGRNAMCRACCATARREHRKRKPDLEREQNRRVIDKRRRQKVASTYVVLRPNGHGYIEQCRIDAASPAHAIEQAAQEEGEYIAVPEGRFQVMAVAPVQAFRVVAKP